MILALAYSSGKKTKESSTIKFVTPFFYRSFTKALPCRLGPGMGKNKVVEGNNNLRLSISRCSITAAVSFCNSVLPLMIVVISRMLYICNCFGFQFYNNTTTGKTVYCPLPLSSGQPLRL
jgi:hypothetical protein